MLLLLIVCCLRLLLSLFVVVDYCLLLAVVILLIVAFGMLGSISYCLAVQICGPGHLFQAMETSLTNAYTQMLTADMVVYVHVQCVYSYTQAMSSGRANPSLV